jgi:AraC family transcriptional regulator
VLADVLLRGEACDGAETLAWATVLGRHLARHYRAADPVGHAKIGPRGLGVHAAIRFIDDNLPEKLTVAELAQRAGMSRVRFARSFKEATGTSPYRYIIARRLSKARQLLASSRLSLGEIAYAVGFCSQSHLTSTFHRSVGVTPREYREALEKYLP